MAGIYGDSPEDKFREQQLNEYLDGQEEYPDVKWTVRVDVVVKAATPEEAAKIADKILRDNGQRIGPYKIYDEGGFWLKDINEVPE